MSTSNTIYSELELAKIGLWLDDPYGDGIRLEKIRNPSPARVAAMEFVSNGQRTIDGIEKEYIDRGLMFVATKSGQKQIKLNNVLR